MKKIALLLAVLLLPMVASAEKVEIGGIYYNLVAKANAAEVMESPNGYTGSVVIPAIVTYNGVEYTVMRILEKAFSGCKDLTSVTIPSTVTKIGNNAFWYSGITSITIPKGVTSIEEQTFYCCENLASVILPDGLTSIGNYAFSSCYNLTSIELPNSVKSIGVSAFYECSSLSSIMIPNGLTSIANYLFCGCSSLTSMVIPNSVTSIGGYAFFGCSSLSSITIPGSVTHLSQKTFSGCRGLTSITFLGSEISIERSVFLDCEALTAVYISDLSSWCKMLFEDYSSNPLYYAHHLYVGEEEVRDLVIPNNVTSIGDYAFEYCSSLTSVMIPDNVTSIGSYAFIECSGLSSLTIPNSVTNVGKYAFYNCSGLNSLSISNSLISIEYATFHGCSGLTSIFIPNSVTNIEGAAFRACSGLTSVEIPNSVTNIKYGAFCECSSLFSLTLGSGVKSIESMAFGTCPKLMDVYSWSVGVPGAFADAFKDSYIEYATLHVPASSIDAYRDVSPWNQFMTFTPLETQTDYRPFVEDGKVWKVGTISGNPVQVVDYYYFDGDTIIDGKTCKQMMCQRYVAPDYSNEDWTPEPSLSYVGAWYEENQKVYFYDERTQSMALKYDFSIGDNESLQLIDDEPPYIIGQKQTGGLEGFKGVYRDVMTSQNIKSTTWLEGIGGIDGPMRNAYAEAADHAPEFLMSCTIGDEVIYLNDEYEDGATPEFNEARDRIDFTHTIKIKPKAPKVKAPRKIEAMSSLYGEYNDQQLGINLNSLDDAYQVSITDEAGKALYEKTVDAGTIVGLNIDISTYAKGRYTVTVENSREVFTGIFETLTTGIEEARNKKAVQRGTIYDLQGRLLLGKPSKGLYIQDGKKYLAK